MNRNCLTAYVAEPWQREGQFWVAPSTLMVPGVHCGSGGCQLWTPDVIRAMEEKWHSVPLTWDHPMIGNSPVSVNHSAEVYAAHVIGMVTKPFFDHATKSLKATLRVPDGIHGLEQIKASKEVSVGVFTTNSVEQGQFNGKRFVGRTLTADPDHCAIVDKGACDWSSGCGIRTHSAESLTEIAGRTLAAWINSQLGEGENVMANYQDQGVYPPEVYGEKTEQEELEILRQWENFDGMEPPEIQELRAKHANKQGQDQGYANEAVIPPDII